MMIGGSVNAGASDASSLADDVNKAMKAAAEGKMKGIIEYVEDPIVSADILGNANTCIFDSLLTAIMDGNFVKVLA